MADTTLQNPESLFSSSPGASAASNTASIGGFSSAGSGFGGDISQSEKDAIMRQIHPIFLTTHSDDKPQVVALSNFDKFLNFLRLCLEGFLKFVDIIIDAAIQIARLGVWVVAITGVLIVVTLMTNTTDKFIDLLNESVFKAFGWDTRIEKVPTATESDTTAQTTPEYTSPLASDAIGETVQTQEEIDKAAARKARIEAAKKAAAENAQASDTSETN